MSVIFKGEDHEARKGRNDLGSRSYTRVFKLETTAISDDVFDVGSHPSLPSIGDIYPRDAGSFCQSLDVECVAGWKQWRVTAEYAVSEAPNQGPPENDPYKLSWSSEIYQEPVFREATEDQDAVCNSAGDYFVDPAPQRDAAQLIAKIKQNYQVIPQTILTLQNTVNESAITIGGLTIDAQLAKMTRVEISSFKQRGDYRYYEVSFEIHIKKEGWRPTILDAGLREIDPNDETKRIHIKDDEEVEITSPVPLDGEGKRLVNPSPSTARFKTFQIYAEADLTVLPGVS